MAVFDNQFLTSDRGNYYCMKSDKIKSKVIKSDQFFVEKYMKRKCVCSLL